MEKTVIFGELLYIGFVAEKGRCKPQGIWKVGYKNILYKHIKILNEISNSLLNEFNFEKDQLILKEFFDLCEEEGEIRKFYPISEEQYNMLYECDFKVIDSLNIKKNSNLINELIFYLSGDILELLNKKGVIDKKNVYMLLRSVHNLPRYYLENDIATLCNLKQNAIGVQNALEYSFSNMDDMTKKKYYNLYNEIL